jgi:PKD repeat protein
MREKRIIWIWLITMLVTSLAVTVGVTSSPTTNLVIDPSTSTGAVGGSFPIDVNLYDVTNLYAWNVEITFNKDIIQVLSLTREHFFEKSGYYTAWQIKEMQGQPWGVINNTAGFIIIGDTFLPPLPPTGVSGVMGTLFSITFEIMAEGVSPIHFQDSGLQTVVGGQTFMIPHQANGGVFDNRVENALPIATFTCPLTGVVGLPLTFTSTSTDDGWLISEEWDFGDSETATGTVVEHTYAMAGTYTVTLTVTDNDLATATATYDMVIQIWMEGGDMPDLIPYYAKPEHPDLDEAYGNRHLNLLGKVGNPTDVDYEVYVRFQLLSKDEVKLLGYLNTDVQVLAPGEKAILSADFDTSNPDWTAWSGGYWVIYGYVHWRMHKYIAFATCYSRPVGTEDWTKGYVTDYLSWHVKSVRHDIAIVGLWANATTVNPGDVIEISANVTNEGAMSETFTVPITYDGVTLEEHEVTLAPGESQVLTTLWDTTGVDLDVYIVKAKLPLVTYEKDTTDQSALIVVHIVAPS